MESVGVKQVEALGLTKEEILRDYRLIVESREASVLGRREVLTGKAKFGIFGDGKELAQVAMAHFMQPGDIRAGYYRDQTIIFATGMGTIRQFFAQLYADPDPVREPFSAGRQMNAHFATHFLHEDGTWKDLTKQVHSAADLSPVASQMAKMVGLAQASKLYRKFPQIAQGFSNQGNEVVWGTIGDASCAEGIFWESLNAAAVLQVPLIISVWDDGYGISVPIDYQIAKKSISEAAKGFLTLNENDNGIYIYKARGWNYPELLMVYKEVSEKVRKEHRPALVHVYEVTQPQGHSTSGSHERYKPKERLQWEKDYDCIARMRQWILENGIATAEELDQIEQSAKEYVRKEKDAAWQAFIGDIKKEIAEVNQIFTAIAAKSRHREEILKIKTQLERNRTPLRRNIDEAIQKVQIITRKEQIPELQTLKSWKLRFAAKNVDRYDSHLYSENQFSALMVPEIKPEYAPDAPEIPGYQILNRYFDSLFARDPRVLAFGEDVGRLGDVNQAFAGLQAKYGEDRIFDTGIREATIVGQAIGLALRGFRPIAEIQYLDYLLYALQIMSDDIATMRYRTKGRQKLPLIIRTRGHRLEGIWHSGSLMGGIIHLVRGMLVLVPRNMTQAAGFYNTVLQSDEPALIVEVLNGYRLREKLPSNLERFTVPVGVPEVLREGKDVTLVTYGACCRIVMQAAQTLATLGIDAEVIDVRSLLPFDVKGIILESLEKTNRIVFIDEDVPGGTTAYMMQQVLEVQGGYYYLDSPPLTIPGKPHRPAYGSDGDYYSKPNHEQIVEAVYRMMNEVDPKTYPEIF